MSFPDLVKEGDTNRSPLWGSESFFPLMKFFAMKAKVTHPPPPPISFAVGAHLRHIAENPESATEMPCFPTQLADPFFCVFSRSKTQLVDVNVVKEQLGRSNKGRFS